MEVNDNVTDEDSLEVYRNVAGKIYNSQALGQPLSEPSSAHTQRPNIVQNGYDPYEDDYTTKGIYNTNLHPNYKDNHSAFLSKKTRTESVV